MARDLYDLQTVIQSGVWYNFAPLHLSLTLNVRVVTPVAGDILMFQCEGSDDGVTEKVTYTVPVIDGDDTPTKYAFTIGGEYPFNTEWVRVTVTSAGGGGGYGAWDFEMWLSA